MVSTISTVSAASTASTISASTAASSAWATSAVSATWRIRALGGLDGLDDGRLEALLRLLVHGLGRFEALHRLLVSGRGRPEALLRLLVHGLGRLDALRRLLVHGLRRLEAMHRLLVHGLCCKELAPGALKSSPRGPAGARPGGPQELAPGARKAEGIAARPQGGQLLLRRPRLGRSCAATAGPLTPQPLHPSHLAAQDLRLRGLRAGGCGQFRRGLCTAEVSAASLSKTARSARVSEVFCRAFAETGPLRACSMATCNV